LIFTKKVRIYKKKYFLGAGINIICRGWCGIRFYLSQLKIAFSRAGNVPIPVNPFLEAGHAITHHYPAN